ncbi:cupredoxin domain-containing protein [Cohnella sp. WQ 127256]|uniref:cupredoxin domain-containing protein n=1 Tax=Cohnella sp. WQ 127256 TaxID=2938790 RepID=UPI0021189720|nr:cupredoxin domain-containing protein [Cohnella sp. WQ 127256]
MKKWTILGAVLLAAMVISTGCGGNKKEEASASPEASSAAAGGAKAITIEATNFKFDQQEIKVKKGEEVSITLKNTQGNHAINIEGYDKEIKANKTVTFVADKTGEFKFICSIFCGKGHEEMIGKLIVE